jgi:cytochrome P450
MFSPVTGIFFRKSIIDHHLKDIPIPKGMNVVARNRPNFFKEEYFKDPFVFEPERWAEANPNLHPYAFLPFSSGARTCLGNNLSLMESKIVLAVLLKRYKTIKLTK